MSNQPSGRKLHFAAHRIVPATAALGAGLVAASGAQAQVARPDSFDVVLVYGHRIVGNVLDNDTGLTEANVDSYADGAIDYRILSDGQVRVEPRSGACGMTSFARTYNATDGASVTNSIVTLNYIRQTVDDAFQTRANVALDGDVMANDYPAPNAVIVVGFSAPLRGTVGPPAPDGSGAFRYTPAKNQSGPDTFNYEVRGGSSCTGVTGRVDVLVLPNAGPDSYFTPFGTPLCGPNVLFNDAGNGISLVSVGTPSSGTATISPEGDLCFTPAAGFSGSATLDYVVNDVFGSNATATVEVIVGNADPIANPDLASTVANVAVSGNVLSNDSDPDGDSLSAVLVDAPASGNVLLNPNGDFTYTPTPGSSGNDLFRYAARDTDGANAVADVAVMVLPVGTDDNYATPFGTALCGPNVLANDIGSGLTVIIVYPPAQGSATISPAGDLCYTPPAGFSGTDTLQYALSDEDNLNLLATVTVVVGNGLPLALDDAASTSVGNAVSGNVLDNDTDPNGDALSAGLVTAPGFGTAVVAPDGAFTYTPAAGQSGVDSFSYAADDGSANVVANVAVTVNPIAIDDSYTGTYEAPVAGNVLSNDLGSGLGAQLLASSAEGTVVLNPDGSFIFTPAAGFSGTTSFDYRANGDDGVSDDASATFTIAAAIPTLVIAGGDGQSTGAGANFPNPLAVRVQIDGADAAGVRVCFVAEPGPDGASAFLSAPEATTGPDGIARITARANALPGGLQVEATLCDTAGVGAVAFGLTILAPVAAPVTVPVATPAWLALLAGLLAWLGWRRRRPD